MFKIFKDVIDNVIRLMKLDNNLKHLNFISPFMSPTKLRFPIASIHIINGRATRWATNNIELKYEFFVRIIIVEKETALSNFKGEYFEYIINFINNNYFILDSDNKTIGVMGTGFGGTISYNLEANEEGNKFGGQAFYVDVPVRIKK